MSTFLTKPKRVRTTIDLSPALLARAQNLADQGVARSRNALIVAALEHFLDHLERETIDAQFAAMADDVDYHALNLTLAKEFAASDWEALELDGAKQ